MEKLVQPYDMECMKMAILKHEETFKQQVHELHRLYQIQRILMKNMQRSMQNQETWSLKSGKICSDYKSQEHDLGQPASNAYDTDNNGNHTEIEADESEIELTLGPTSYSRRKLKPTSKSTSMASFSSSTGSSEKSRLTVENSRVLNAEERVRRVDRSLKHPPWLRQVLI